MQGCEANEIPPVTIVGNKCDLEEARVVSYELGQSVAKELGPTVGYVETSAKANIKVEEASLRETSSAVSIQFSK